MKTYILLFGLLLFSTVVLCQHTLTGYVNNSNNEPLAFATVVVLQSEDSSMVAFGMTNEEGLYKLDLEEKGSYVLQYSYVGFTSLYRSLETTWEMREIKTPTVYLKESTTLLKEIQVEAERIPMGILGDTIVYDAKAFKTREGATVEDLLKKLPGIQVGKDGSIKAQGEDVNKVLVDGKEFFGNDPKIATRNLEAEAVDKVELFDKKSEMAEFTGVDDGQEEKTINLKLKEDYKKGGFGRVSAALGSQETFHGKLNYNLFNTQSRLSIIGNSNNINKQAFSLQDYMDFLGGLGNLSNMNSGMISSTGMQSNEGINIAHSIGTNLNHSFNEKISLNANYFYLSNDRNLDKQISSSNFSTAEQFNSNEQIANDKLDQNHRFNSKLQWKLNPMTGLSWFNNFKGLDILTQNQSNTLFSSSSTPESTTNNQLKSRELQYNWDSKLLFKKKFQKKGRSWISSLRYEQAKAQQTNDLMNDAFGSPLIQFQEFTTAIEKQRLISTYTEPFFKKWYASIRYQYDRDWSSPQRSFFDLEEGNRLLNGTLSGKFERTVEQHSSRLNIRRNRKKVKINVFAELQQIDLKTSGINGQYHYLLPGTSLDWKLKNGQSIDFSYTTSVKTPSLAQLITIPNNLNPNRNYIGNPELTPEYKHQLYFKYNFFDNFNFTSVFFTLIAKKTENKIVEQSNINPDFTIDATPVNTNLYESLSSFITVSQPIKPLRIIYQLRGNAQWSRFNSWLNNSPTEVGEQNYTALFSIERKKKEKWDYRIGVDLSWTQRRYAINPDFDQSFANYNWFIDLDWEPQEDLLLTVGYNMRRYNDVFFSSELQLHFIDAKARKSFKNDQWAIELTAHDILNQTIGLNRSGTDNSLREERFNARAQYFMLGLSCKLGRKKKKA